MDKAQQIKEKKEQIKTLEAEIQQLEGGLKPEDQRQIDNLLSDI
jgi:hypothetical protein